jgi:ribonuclease HI
VNRPGQPSLFSSEPGPTATANIDGGSRGNPGPAGYGVRIERENGSVVELKGSLGICTNNVAEYQGLLAALSWAIDNGVRRLRVRSDSELLVKQMRGEYRVKHAGLQPLAAEARELVGRIGRVTFEHVRREMNRDADRLANEAMDESGKSEVASGK